MNQYAALDVSMERTAICVIDETGRKLCEAKVATCPDAIASWLAEKAANLTTLGMETGPLAVWLWNELTARGLPIVCLDARHANAALSMMPNKTDRHDAAGLAQIVRTGWYKEVRIKSHGAYVVRALLAARDVLVGIRGRIENEIRGLLKTFGVMFGKKVGGFARRADEIVAEELAVSPELKIVIETLVEARRAIVERIKVLDRRAHALAKENRMARLFMTAPGVGAITALSVGSAFDDPRRFARSANAGAYFGLTPRRYESGEVSRNGRVSKRGNRMTRTHLYEAANVILTRSDRFSTLKAWGLRLAKASGFKRAKVAVARKLAVILHAMWKANAPFRWGAAAAS
jgi:transposase